MFARPSVGRSEDARPPPHSRAGPRWRHRANAR